MIQFGENVGFHRVSTFKGRHARHSQLFPHLYSKYQGKHKTRPGQISTMRLDADYQRIKMTGELSVSDKPLQAKITAATRAPGTAVPRLADPYPNVRQHLIGCIHNHDHPGDCETKADEITHQCPPKGSGIMPCCGRTPFEVSRSDRMATNPSYVTCKGADLR